MSDDQVPENPPDEPVLVTGEYEVKHVPGHVLVCQRCGAMVAYRASHDKWHNDIDEFHRRIGQRKCWHAWEMTESRDSEPMRGE